MMKRLTPILFIVVFVLNCTADEFLVVDEIATEPYATITTNNVGKFYTDKDPAIDSLTCECDPPESVIMNEQWIKEHTPAEIGMVFSMVSVAIQIGGNGGDYSEICCSVLRKLKQ